jgi:outer membrane murein-binding lipoprotein Lpp
LTPSVLLSLIGLAVTLGGLVLTVGVAWGTLSAKMAAEASAREAECARLKEAIAACRADAHSAIASRSDSHRERVQFVASDVDGLGTKIDALGTKIEAVVSALSARVVELHTEFRLQGKRIDHLERLIEGKQGARVD